MNEISLTGVETIADQSPQFNCDVEVVMGQTIEPITNKVLYVG
jgi:hypothetical protein